MTAIDQHGGMDVLSKSFDEEFQNVIVFDLTRLGVIQADGEEIAAAPVAEEQAPTDTPSVVSSGGGERNAVSSGGHGGVATLRWCRS